RWCQTCYHKYAVARTRPPACQRSYPIRKRAQHQVRCDSLSRRAHDCAIGLCSLAPQELRRTQIDQDLIKKGDRWLIIIPPEDNKTRTHLEFQIPEDLENEFSMYINYVRPSLLLQPECKALWVSSRGGALSPSSFEPIIATYTSSRIGMRI